jgi:peptidoglycan/xylan/chitin deacetylase (PgdA/CDA1 family)
LEGPTDITLTVENVATWSFGAAASRCANMPPGGLGVEGMRSKIYDYESIERGETTTATGRRWAVRTLPRSLTLTIAWHLAVLAGWGAAPAEWPWWLACLAVNHAAVTAAGLWPRSSILGRNWTRLPDTARNANAVALTIDDGPDPAITPQTLDLLDLLDVRATFFLIGDRALCYPALTREIVARGHKVENHTQAHAHTFSVKGMRAIAREVENAQRTLSSLTGERPAFFRAPAGLRNVLLEPVLQKLDLQLVAWTRRGFDTRERDPQRVLERLLANLSGRDILLLHDGNAAVTLEGQAVLLAVLPPLVDAVRSRGLHFVTLQESV